MMPESLETSLACGTPAHRRTTTRVSFVAQARAVAAKDLRIELRSRELLYTMAFFAAMVVLIFSFAFVGDQGVVAEAVPGILWVAIAFSGTVGLSRAFDRERESDTMRGLLLSPSSRLAIFFGKALSMFVFIVVVELVLVPMVALLFGAPLFAETAPLLVILLLGTLGFSIVGSVFAAMLLRVRSRDVLLPVVLYPILVPLFIAGTKGTAAIVVARPDVAVAWGWIQFLAVYDAVFLVVAMWTFESLVIE